MTLLPRDSGPSPSSLPDAERNRDAGRTSRLPLTHALLLALAALSPVAACLSQRDLWAPDEPRYGRVVIETLEQGHWLVPHVNGAPYAEKPPLYFWLAAILSVPFGCVSAITVRLAAALLAAGAVLLTARLARVWFGDPALAVTSAVVFASFAGVMWNAPRAGLDLPLTFFVLLTVERGSAWWHHRSLVAAVLAGAFWAGAVLVKGPVGFFLPPLAMLGGWILSRHRPRFTNPGWWIAPLVALALVLAWLLPAVAEGGAAYEDRLLGQLGARATGAEGSHVRWFGYYVERAGPLLLPWLFHVVAGLGVFFVLHRVRHAHRFGLGACLAGTAVLLLVLSSFATKRELYLLPAFPFAAMLAAYAIHHDLSPRLRSWGRALLALFLLVLGAGVALVPPLGARVGARWSDVELAWMAPRTITLAVFMSLGLVMAAFWVWSMRRRVRTCVWGGALFALLGGVLVHVALLPLIDPAKSFRRVALAAEEASLGGAIYLSGWDQGPNLLWRLDRKQVDYVEAPEALARLLASNAPPVAVVATREKWNLLRKDGSRFEAVRVTWEGGVGERPLVVLANARDP